MDFSCSSGDTSHVFYNDTRFMKTCHGQKQSHAHGKKIKIWCYIISNIWRITHISQFGSTSPGLWQQIADICSMTGSFQLSPSSFSSSSKFCLIEYVGNQTLKYALLSFTSFGKAKHQCEFLYHFLLWLVSLVANWCLQNVSMLKPCDNILKNLPRRERESFIRECGNILYK